MWRGVSGTLPSSGAKVVFCAVCPKLFGVSRDLPLNVCRLGAAFDREQPLYSALLPWANSVVLFACSIHRLVGVHWCDNSVILSSCCWHQYVDCFFFRSCEIHSLRARRQLSFYIQRLLGVRRRSQATSQLQGLEACDIESLLFLRQVLFLMCRW